MTRLFDDAADYWAEQDEADRASRAECRCTGSCGLSCHFRAGLTRSGCEECGCPAIQGEAA